MANPDGELTVAQRLGRALDRGLFPAGGPAEAAERLIERLERPARVALLGLPGSGKSSILNLLVGAVVVPETLRLPTIVVQHGDVARMLCTLTDGTTKILQGSNLAEVLPLAPALVTLELDLPALRVISLLEVSAGPMEAEQKRAATWASKRADIVIWCTTSYLPKEQAVWESLPDGVKDNSFMFLTKVDLLGSRDSAQAMHERVELRAGEEFRQILSISAKQARAAMPVGEPVNRELFRDSGAGAVITAIKTRVQSGRRADTDTAELLLARHVEASELVARRFAEEEAAAPQQWTPPPELEVKAAPVTEPIREPAVVPAAVPEPVVDPEPVLAAEPEVVETVEEPQPEPPLAEPYADQPPEAAEPVEPESAVEAIVVPEPEPQVTQPEPEPEPEPGGRRRFADRIKRVASDGDPGAAPMVPLRSTWKSKNEPEAAYVAEPEPRASEPARRPRVTQPAKDAATVTPDMPEVQPEDVGVDPGLPEPDLAVPDIPESIVEEPVLVIPDLPDPMLPEPDLPEPDLPEPDLPEPELSEQALSVSSEPSPARAPRAVTPRPAPAAEAPRSIRPNLFGARRPGEVAASPLPDLSSLRATQDEMDAALESDGNGPEASDDWDDAAPLPEPESGLESQLGPVEPEASDPEPAPIARPRLFERTRPAAPGPTAPATHRPEPAPRATPISRLPAPPRESVASPASAPTSVVAAEAGLLSPRAIMRREPQVESPERAPRRERPRIAARAVPVTAPAAGAQVPAMEKDLLVEAVRLLIQRSSELERAFDPDAKIMVDVILDHARETSELVAELISRGQSEALRRINNDLGGVMDTITLMQLEKGNAPADDALTLLLQLKRELETLSAA